MVGVPIPSGVANSREDRLPRSAAVDRFGETELRLLEPLAASAAVAIENARLFTEAARQHEFLETVVTENPVAIVTLGAFYSEPDDAKALRSLPRRLAAFVIGLLSRLRRSSVPVSGAIVTERAPESARGRNTSSDTAAPFLSDNSPDKRAISSSIGRYLFVKR